MQYTDVRTPPIKNNYCLVGKKKLVFSWLVFFIVRALRDYYTGIVLRVFLYSIFFPSSLFLEYSLKTRFRTWLNRNYLVRSFFEFFSREPERIRIKRLSRLRYRRRSASYAVYARTAIRICTYTRTHARTQHRRCVRRPCRDHDNSREDKRA